MMKYKIVYCKGQYPDYVHSRKDLIERLKLFKGETITDIRKIYKNGFSETVMEKYEKYIKRKGVSI